jgi:hypothetical protein
MNSYFFHKYNCDFYWPSSSILSCLCKAHWADLSGYGDDDKLISIKVWHRCTNWEGWKVLDKELHACMGQCHNHLFLHYGFDQSIQIHIHRWNKIFLNVYNIFPMSNAISHYINNGRYFKMYVGLINYT